MHTNQGLRVLSPSPQCRGTQQSVIDSGGPRARIYRYVIHFDADGEEVLVGLPDDTVQLLTTTVDRCKCPRCLLSDQEGRSLA